jgi:hypothetical protein
MFVVDKQSTPRELVLGFADYRRIDSIMVLQKGLKEFDNHQNSSNTNRLVLI